MRDDVEFRGFKYYLLKFLRSRSLYVVLLVAGLTGVLLWKLYDMQIVRGDEYKKKATETVLTTAELTVKARRGNIYDCNGVLLATTRTAYKVNMVNTPDDQPARDRMYLRLIELFEADNDTYSNMLRRYITPELEWGSALAGDEKAAARSNWINTLVSGRRPGQHPHRPRRVQLPVQHRVRTGRELHRRAGVQDHDHPLRHVRVRPQFAGADGAGVGRGQRHDGVPDGPQL